MNTEKFNIQFLNSGNFLEIYQLLLGRDRALFLLSGFNNAIASRYIQIFNQENAPVNPEIPIVSFIVASQSNFSYQPVNGQRLLHNTNANPFSLWVVSSTTGNLYTPSGTLTDLWLNLQIGQKNP